MWQKAQINAGCFDFGREIWVREENIFGTKRLIAHILKRGELMPVEEDAVTLLDEYKADEDMVWIDLETWIEQGIVTIH